MMKTIIGCESSALEEYEYGYDSEYCMLCPRCGYIYIGDDDDITGEYQYRDYVSTDKFLKGMLWCDNCDSRFVIDDYTDTEVLSREKSVELYPALFECDSKTTNSDGEPFKYFYQVTFAKIVEIVDNSLTSYECREKLLYSQVEEILAVIDDEDSLKIVLNKYSITRGDVDDMYKYNLALECGTYDAFHPLAEYPEGIELDHAGCYIYLKCFSESTGKYYKYKMWGD